MRPRTRGYFLIFTCISLCQIAEVLSNEESCQPEYFRCEESIPDGICLPNTWRCDGFEDCDEGEDERNCDDKDVSKRSTEAEGPNSLPGARNPRLGGRLQHDNHGPYIELIECPPNYLRCPREEVCIPISKFCDKVPDCPYFEGDEKNCTLVSDCDKLSCDHRCQVTLEGPMCYCPPGKQPNGSACVDVNGCDYPDLFCDQICKSKEGGFACDCVRGYNLINQTSCLVVNETATLLVADSSVVRRLTISDGTDVVPPVNIPGHGIKTIDFNYRNHSACWLSYELTKKRTTMQCVDLDNLTNGWTVNTEVSLDIITQIALDWITGNWYFVDHLMKRIILCDSNVQNCRVIIELKGSNIINLRLDPTRGLMFFTIIDAKVIAYPRGIDGNTAIVRASLDGENQIAILSEKLDTPYDLTLDFANQHLYWTDTNLKTVMRIGYDGSNLRKIYSPYRKINQESLRGYGISVFENSLYIASQDPVMLAEVHRYDYGEPARQITTDVKKPFQLHVYHSQRQPNLPEGVTNPCENNNCDQLCIPVWSDGQPQAQCYCAAGYVMDQGTCIEKTDCAPPECIDESCISDRDCRVDTPCRKDYNRCPLSKCFPLTWWCDGESDCDDATDEKFCAERTCTVVEFRCKNGQCIDSSFLCDGTEDCNDRTDEIFCKKTCDKTLEFACGGNGSCIPIMLKCNGIRDCIDGSDEDNCTAEEHPSTSETCHHNIEFTCADGQCIPTIWKCDGDEDCFDDSDEKNCDGDQTPVSNTCSNDTNSFLCNNRCIPSSWKCDGDYDCTDKSDEKDCENKCEPPHFFCKTGNKCIRREQYCDNKQDCEDNSDETDCGKCSTWGICSQNCTELENGSHQCSCFEGYELKADNYTCKPIGGEPVYIIFSNQHQMRRVELTNLTYASLVSGLKNAIALDFYYKKNWIFWTDVVDDKIFRGTLLGNSTFGLTNIEPIIDMGLATTEGLAIDWVGENIYWVESNLDQIEVAKLNGSYRTTLIAGDMLSPRAIVLDPRVGSLFWTDWDSEHPRIETCSLSGTERRVIFNITKLIGSGWPNGLTIDYDFYRLYWIDARSDSIHTTNYDGLDHRLILKGHDKIRHPFALTLFGNHVYWTDWRSSALLKANKFDGSNVTVIQNIISQPFDLQVYHQLRQPDMHNPCADNNCGCSHLCLLGYNQSCSCHCPHLYKLKDDNKTCESDNTFLLFVKKNEIRGVDLQNAYYNVIPTITIPNVDTPTAIDYDLDTERLYWADKALNVINSALINGSGVETIINSGISSPEGFAIDWLSKNMYFSSLPFDNRNHQATISVAKLDGAYRAEITPTHVSAPSSLAVSPKHGLLFWSDKMTNGQSVQHYIGCSYMDGSNGKILINNISNPTSLSVDTEREQLFWADTKSGDIWHCDLDGTNKQKIQQKRRFVKIQAITVYHDMIYLSHDHSKITHINRQGNGYTVLRDKTDDVLALKVFDINSRKGGSNSCSKDNGKCAHLCLPVNNISHVCKCTAGYRLVGNNCEGIESFLMWSSGNEIHGISFNFTEKMKALPHISKVSKASAVDFHAATDTIYWVDGTSYTISSIKRDLTGRMDILEDQVRGITGMAVDWIAGNVYWTDYGEDIIEAVRIDGRDQRFVVIHGNMDKPQSIVVHPQKGLLFWADTGSPPKIEQARLDGSQRKAIVTSNISSPNDLTIDYDTDMLYWCDMGKLQSYNIITGVRTVLMSFGAEDCVSITLFKDYLYWIQGGTDGSIKRVQKASPSKVEVIRENLGPQLRALKAFDKSRQTGDNPCKYNNGGCQEFCFYLGSNTVRCACSYGRLSQTDFKTCEPHEEFLLYSKVTAIASLGLDQTNRNHPVKPFQDKEHLRNVIGLTAHFGSRRIYFSDIQRGDIQFVPFNGTEYTVVVSSVGSAEGLAYDEDMNFLYWTSYTNSSISRVLIDPETGKISNNASIEKLVQLTVTDHPRAIVVDSCSSRMFWTNWHDESPRIQRSYMNGFKPEDLITDQVWTPNGLAIDHQEQRLYWSDARLDKIERCDFDGKNRVVVVASLPEHPFGIAVYGNYLYWTDWIRRAVIRSNKYDGNDIHFMQENLERQPMGIVVVAKNANNCSSNPCYNNAYGCEDLCFHDSEGRVQCGCTEGILLADGKRCGPANARCTMSDFVCHDAKQCLPIEKVCNNITDCLDGSDEFPEVCSRRKCDLEYFTCNNFRCVSLDKFCDRKDDCLDGSDEINCKCNADEFQCQSGLCIKKHYRCDRDRDCPDFDDEIGCNLTCDHIELFENEKGPILRCNKTSQCIMESWKCDGNMDCWDGSDEMDCDNKTIKGPCSHGGFLCGIGTCIPQQWVCDADNDCTDNSDEANCNYTCESTMFQCNESKVCLPRSWECDGHPDCSNMSDEGDHCKHVNRTCKEEEFKCEGTGRCIPKQWTCDGDIDCRDAEDEKADSVCLPCSADEFQCRNGQCIGNIFMCDRDDDCGDGSDEPDTCVYGGCAEEKKFRCKENGNCIDLDLQCDGYPDCTDLSDEEDCYRNPWDKCNSSDHFLCDNRVCISSNLVCNGRDDCGDFSDEPEICNINECDLQHVCSHTCVDKMIGYRCECYPGYKLRSDNVTCENIDECKTQYPCSHFCIDTPGSYHCQCADRYQLEPNQRSCKFIGEEKPVLIVANRYYIRKVTYSGQQTLLRNDLSNAVAIGFHHEQKHIYWTDITSKNSTINRMVIGGNETEIIHSSTVRNPDGLAVDWVGLNLYWCDKTTDTIEVSRLNGYYRKVLIKEGLEEPRALEVFPAKGFMFYTDWGEKAHISRATMDGSLTEKIITEDLSWPNALTIDYVTENIFWADASLDYIAVADINGKNRRIILDKNLPHTFALTTFQDYIFWTDWEKGSIQKVHKFSGKDRQTVCNIPHRLMDIQVYHEMRQKPLQNNPCANGGGCSHLCLLRPEKNGKLGKVCACPENHNLLLDGTCQPDCTSSQILCPRSSKCIPFWWKCDGQWDCDDGFDEPADCHEYKCEQPGLFRCNDSSTHCLPPTEICDGEEQCGDGSDELNCDKYHCMDGYTKCKEENKCIPKTRLCDGTPHCSNGTDEQECDSIKCLENQFKCDTHRCVPYVWRCDGDDDCGDNSDEPDTCKETVCNDNYFKCKSGRCIPDSWKCDGDVDCGLNDNTDEDYEHCHNRTCDESFFRCDNNHCIPGRWRCDHDNDCRDQSDEKDCNYRQCTNEEFTCENKKCIPASWRCNGEINCEDGSDEKQCSDGHTCSDAEFGCSGICIPRKWKCDEDVDCPDGLDEKDCNLKNCEDNKFQCSNKQHCIPQLWKCDGDPDCDDSSDEDYAMCRDHTCPLGRFRCRNHKCLFTSKRCDGIDQCGDGSDELNCYYDTVCRQNEFKCKQDSKCIPMHKVCDGRTDCYDKSDENSNTTCVSVVQPCSGPNNCHHSCANITDIGYKCGCKQGFSLAEDGFSCKDVDLCKKWGTCSQLCKKTRQLYKCSCEVGYQSIINDVTGVPTCIAKGSVIPQLMVANEDVLIRSDVNRGQGGEENIPFHLPSGDKMLSIDVDMTSRSAWTGFFISHDRTINMFSITPPTGINLKRKENDSRAKRGLSGVPKKIIEDVAEPRGITVDWIGKHIYWTDSHTNTIEMADINSNPRKVTLVSDNLDQPYSVVVEPELGKLYWTDRGFPPKIESCNLDGSGRKDLVKDDIIWPNGLAIDFANKRIYWTDTKKHTIETVMLTGEDRHVVKLFSASDPPFMLDIFEDYLYVSLYKSHSIVRLNKFGKSGPKNELQYLMENMTAIFDIIIMHPAKQKHDITNYCATNSTYDPCSGALCVNVPQAKSGAPKFKCICSKDAEFEDGKCNFKKPCQPGHCQNGGTCHLHLKGQSKCSCLPGTSGTFCEKCDNYCLNAGVCNVNKAEPPTCQCQRGYYGDKCEKYKCTGYCKNGGLCFIIGTDPHCRCPLSHNGSRCEIPVQDTCSNFCENNGVCRMERIYTISRRRCQCVTGFKGERCEQCYNYYCLNGAICHHDSDNRPYCECPKLMSNRKQCLKTLCEEYCLNGGKCQYEENTDTRSCTCPIGFTGKRCEVNQDRCASYCKNGATCLTLNTIEKPLKCICRRGFTGPRCGISASKCKTHLCYNKGVCKLDKFGTPYCVCPSVYNGSLCATCRCQNGGICKINPRNISEFICVCKQQIWTGKFCEKSVCSDYCSNGGVCNNCTYDKNLRKGVCDRCTCPAEFQGEKCELQSPRKVAEKSSLVIGVIVPIIAVLLIVLIIVMILVFRRRRDQFKHHRMPTIAHETANPIFSGHHPDMEDDRELSPLDDDDETGLHTGNSGSTIALLQDSTENNLHTDDINFHGVKKKKDTANGKGPYV